RRAGRSGEDDADDRARAPADLAPPAGAGDLDDGPPSPFEPVGVTARYPAPRAGIDSDASRGWIRRVAPVVAARRWLLIGSLALALVAMLAQVAVPAVTSRAIDEALVVRSAPL